MDNKHIDLIEIVNETWKENELSDGTYKIATLEALQKLQEIYEKPSFNHQIAKSDMTEENLKRGNEITAEIKVRKELLINLKREGRRNDGLKVINHSCNDSYDKLATYPGDTVVCTAIIQCLIAHHEQAIKKLEKEFKTL